MKREKARRRVERVEEDAGGKGRGLKRKERESWMKADGEAVSEGLSSLNLVGKAFGRRTHMEKLVKESPFSLRLTSSACHSPASSSGSRKYRSKWSSRALQTSHRESGNQMAASGLVRLSIVWTRLRLTSGQTARGSGASSSRSAGSEEEVGAGALSSMR